MSQPSVRDADTDTNSDIPRDTELQTRLERSIRRQKLNCKCESLLKNF